MLYLARGLSINEISKELGLSDVEAKSILAALIAEGYVREADPTESCPCETCPLRRICGGRAFVSSRTSKVYVLTNKGIKKLAKLLARRSVNK
jgi:predicted ArsR family transcriptional regulator